MHVHILGVCGTFMGGVAQLAQALGHRVTGSDFQVYPPMSTQLERAGIELIEGFDPVQLEPVPDLVVVGNVISRGNPAMEAVLNRNVPYTCGPQWLCDFLLKDKWVLAVAGTHGKTTTATMLAWILEDAGFAPGYLIGGVPVNLPDSARLGESDFFVVEADEYDSAFFDKRSKFVHYRPRTLVLNNLEFDHADIFPDLAAIQRQFHHLVRTVPGQGRIFYPSSDAALSDVIAQGCWSETATLGATGADWQYRAQSPPGDHFEILNAGTVVGRVCWTLSGEHNMRNALAAVAAAHHVGVPADLACEALSRFTGVKRRLELLGEAGGVHLYDDFAHHPTAIATTLAGLRAKVGTAPIAAVIEPRSNTMKQGVHGRTLAQATEQADQVFWFEPAGLEWSLREMVAMLSGHHVDASIDALVAQVGREVVPGTHLVVMSNGGFGGIHGKLLERLGASG